MESSVSFETSHATKPCKEEGKEEVCAKIDEIISTLPEANFFMPLRLYQGYWFYPPFLQGAMFAREKFRAKPEDIFLCSVQKAGTTWFKALSFATLTRTRFNHSENPLLTKVPHDCIPFLETSFIQNYSTVWEPDLPIWATHVPYCWLPKSATDSGCKIVFICRDPKDVYVSLWHYIHKLLTDNWEKISLEEAFELYCKGSSPCGPYWDHVLGYWKGSLEFPDRILFLKYEEMMEDIAFYLKRLAEFMGYPFSLEEENEGAVQKIIDLCSFENLSNLEVNKTGKWGTYRGGIDNNAYYRKGKIGDWKNYLTSEMGERLDKINKEKLEGSGLKF